MTDWTLHIPPAPWTRTDTSIQQRVAIGQRYRDVQTKGFKSLIWIVASVSPHLDGVEHVRLLCAHDETVSKTLGLTVLLDQRRFKRVDHQTPGTATSP